MKTDRELLELAAKACGYTLQEALSKIGKPVSLYSEWNPLTDDGDALRLAVKLCIDVSHGGQVIVAERQSVFDTPEIGVAEQILSGPYAATRRAIVRAAAAIGESMP